MEREDFEVTLGARCQRLVRREKDAQKSFKLRIPLLERGERWGKEEEERGKLN